ncbi:hypothetical protein ACWOFR_08620 [Carnobacterium gallinarum]|uniref:hypothetical protein n=1 Tax=Carnobacterium gallinarum TaxID=2749 RepID=UPI000552D4A5|nr:hypothetical protein [Carnobacterium gallinarum]
MKKYKIAALLVSSVLILTSCKSLQDEANKSVESYRSSLKEEESRTSTSDSSNVRTIDSNEGKAMVTEKVEVLLPPFLEDETVKKESENDIKMFSKIQEFYNDKEIEFYSKSITFLNAYSYYDSSNGEVIFSGILVNGTSNEITEISGFIGDIKIDKYPEMISAVGSFNLSEKYFGTLKPKQAITILITAPIMPSEKQMPDKDIIFEEKEVTAIPYGFEYTIVEK